MKKLVLLFVLALMTVSGICFADTYVNGYIAVMETMFNGIIVLIQTTPVEYRLENFKKTIKYLETVSCILTHCKPSLLYVCMYVCIYNKSV